MIGIYGVEEEIENQIVNEVEAIGFSFIHTRPISELDEDYYLQVVRGQRKSDGKYATWIHNSNLGGLHAGKYDLTYEDSYIDYYTR